MSNTTTDQPTSAQDALILDPAVLFDKMQTWNADGWHVLTPATRVSRFAPGWGASVSLVLLDPTVDYDTGRGIDCYFDPGQMKRDARDPEQHQRGISRVGLDRIGRCASISWDPTFCGRVDTRQIMHVWEYRSIGLVMNFDGQPESLIGTKEVDLRDESAQIGGWSPTAWKALLDENARRKQADPSAKLSWSINGWSDKRVLGARAHGLSLAETKAKERAIRTLGLLPVYTVAQLRKPFVVVKATYLPNLEDPEIRQMVTEAALRGTRALFAPAQARQYPIDVIDITPRALPEANDEGARLREQLEAAARREPVHAGRREAPAEPTTSTGPATAAPALTGVSRVERPAPTPVDAQKPVVPPTPGTPILSAPFTPGAKMPGWRRSVSILHVDTLKSGGSGDRAWALRKITIGIGADLTESHTTLDEGLVQEALEFKQRGALADVNVQPDETKKYLNFVDITRAGEQPSLLDSELPSPAATVNHATNMAGLKL